MQYSCYTLETIVRKRKIPRTAKRFPRLGKLHPAVSLAIKILHITYNKLAVSRSSEKHVGYRYDIYTKKGCWNAKFQFMLLAEKLLHRNIDPALYLKVMSSYGMFRDSKYMPHPTWFAKDKTLETFLWKHRRERNKYELDSDWQKAMRGFVEDDVIHAVASSCAMFEQAKQSGMDSEQAFAMLHKELSPYFVSLYFLRKWGRRELLHCMHYWRKHRDAWRQVRKAFKRAIR